MQPLIRDARSLVAAVVADDLSGAADCAAAFHRAGVSISVGLDDQILATSQSDAVALSTETRDESSLLAAERTTQAFLSVKAFAPACTFKKIDSTLRGHLGPELRAALETSPGTLAVVAPSFPSHGRTMVAGQLLVHGRPIDHHWAVDVPSPTRIAHILDYLRQCGLRVASAQLSEVRSAHLPAVMLEASLHADVLVCDAELEDDLDFIASSGLQSKVQLLWVGSAGLAYHVARQFSPSSAPDEHAFQQRSSFQQNWRRAQKPVAVIVGSANRQSHLQLDELARSCPVVIVPPVALLDPDDPRRSDVQVKIRSFFRAGSNVAIAIEQINEHVLSPASSHGLSSALGELVVDHLDHIGGFVLTGGNTARSVLEVSGTRLLEVCGEVEVGVPVLRSYELDIPVITKAGAFGDAHTLSRCLEAIEPRR